MGGDNTRWPADRPLLKGELVRIKQYRGTSIFSKRAPGWAVAGATAPIGHTDYVPVVILHAPVFKKTPAPWTAHIGPAMRPVLHYAYIKDLMPPTKRIPPEVTVAWVKYRLSSTLT